MSQHEIDMRSEIRTAGTIQPRSTSRFAVPLEDLERVHTSQAQMVELVSSSHRTPDTAKAHTLAETDADGGGE